MSFRDQVLSARLSTHQSGLLVPSMQQQPKEYGRLE
jgi:hypothetical protein